MCAGGPRQKLSPGPPRRPCPEDQRRRRSSTDPDVYDDDHEEMQACEANPDPSSTLGLCAEHEGQIMG